MAEAASAHKAATATREDTSQQRAGRTRRTSADPQRAQQGTTAAAAAAPAALASLSRLQHLADASPRVAQLRRLQALADSHYAPVSQLAGDPEEEELIQGKFASAELQPQLQQAPRANNTGLPDQLKIGIESLSGLSMDQVRVHYNSALPAQLNALAYAQGSDIHLAPGQERHLPHEAWHVVQQAQGRVRPTLQAKGVAINDDQVLEREADVMGSKTVQMMDKQDKKDDKDQKSSPKPTKLNQLPGGAATAAAPPPSPSAASHAPPTYTDLLLLHPKWDNDFKNDQRRAAQGGAATPVAPASVVVLTKQEIAEVIRRSKKNSKRFSAHGKKSHGKYASSSSSHTLKRDEKHSQDQAIAHGLAAELDRKKKVQKGQGK